MSDLQSSPSSTGRTVTITLTQERTRELDRLAEHLGKDIGQLAAELLETEIEAEHGLTFGPYLRKYMYRTDAPPSEYPACPS